MSVRIELPVFVTAGGFGDERYQVRSLFCPALLGEGRTFGEAMRACTRRIRQENRRRITDRTNIEQLLWLAFNPELTVETHPLNLSAGQRVETGPVMVVRFVVGDWRIACLPRLEGHLVMMPASLRLPEQLEAIQAGVDDWLRQRRRELAPQRLDLKVFQVAQGDFVSAARVSLDLRRGGFAFESPSLLSLMAQMSDASDFDGAVELQKVANNLNNSYPDGLLSALDPAPHIDRLHQAIYTDAPAPVVLLGPSGAGRTTLLHAAIRQAAAAHTGDFTRLQRIWHLDPTRIIAGMSGIGMWQRRLEAIVERLTSRLRSHFTLSRQDGLYIDNPVALCRVGHSAGSSLTMSAVLRPYIQQRALPLIIEATAAQWETMEELDRPFTDLFEIIRVTPPPRQQALRSFIHSRERIEAENGISIHHSALKALVALEDRFPSTRVMPGSLIRRLEQISRGWQGVLDAEGVERAFRVRSGLRERLLSTALPLPDAQLRAEVRSQLIGQPEAVAALCAVAHTIRAGLNPPGKPMASLLLIGPTGVGKTEAAKILAGLLYTDEAALVRFDMNEYVDGAAVWRLIGSPGHPDGQLTGRVRHQPFCVLLLDEIEKAHPRVHDLLLQVLDEGRLTDSSGRLVDFSQVVVVMTSNVGAREAGTMVGFEPGVEAISATFQAALRQTFRPEFLNRIDEKIVFRPLALPDIRAIARLQLARLLSREGLMRRTVLLEVSSASLDRIAAAGFDPLMGARALKRALEQRLVAPIAAAVSGLPVEVPVSLHIDDVDGEQVVRIEALPQLTADGIPTLRQRLAQLPTDEAIRWAIAAVEASLERLQARTGGVFTATAGPEGVSAPPEMVLVGQLHRRREALQALLMEEDALPALATSAIRHQLHTRRERISRRVVSRSWSAPTDLHNRISHDNVREVLRELMSAPPAPSSDLDGAAMPIAAALASVLQARALLAARPSTGALFLRSLSAPSPSTQQALVTLQSLYAQLIARAGGLCQCHYRSADGLLRSDAHRNTPVDRVLWFAGEGLVELLGSEEGVQLFYPASSPPIAVQVRVAALPGLDALPAQLAAWAAPGAGQTSRTVIRLHCPPASDPAPGAVTDLRGGRVIAASSLLSPEGIPPLAEWLFHALLGAAEVLP